MRKSVLAAVAAVAIASAAGGALIAHAAPPGPPPPGGPPGGPAGAAPWGPHPGPWMHHGPGPWHHGPGGWHHRPIAPGTFALFFRPADRALTPADVKEIASALLVWNGNHTWKVVDVTKQSGDLIGFAFAAPDNTVIARFTMDSHTGRIVRTG